MREPERAQLQSHQPVVAWFQLQAESPGLLRQSVRPRPASHDADLVEVDRRFPSKVFAVLPCLIPFGAPRGRGRLPKAATRKSAGREPSAPSLGERVLALATGRTRQVTTRAYHRAVVDPIGAVEDTLFGW